MPDILDKFRVAHDLLVIRNYKVDNKIFELLCELHIYICNNKKNEDLKNELAEIFYNIFIEIFMPLIPGEPYQVYPAGKRFYYDAYDKIIEEVNSIYDLNVFSPIWLKDISVFYQVKSQEFEKYNLDLINGRMPCIDRNWIRYTISRHLRQSVDPDKPLEPKDKTPENMYLYEFESALYEENKLKNRFFQEMKYQPLIDLQNKKQAITNLRIISAEPVEDYEEEEMHSWKIILEPINRELLAKYSLFKDNPFVYFYRFKETGDILRQIFMPSIAEFEGKIIKIDEEKNTIALQIKCREFIISKLKAYCSLILRQDSVNYLREKTALNEFIFKNKNLPLKNLIINHKLPKVNLKANISEFCNTNLKESQKKAVKSALNASSFFCIHGPPGTGKTKVLAEIIIQHLFYNPCCRILVTCASNEAMDNILQAFKKILPMPLHHLILRMGIEEKDSENIHSFSFKIKHSRQFTDEIYPREIEIEKNIKKINLLGSQINETEKEVAIVYDAILLNRQKLIKASSGKGRATGIIPSIALLNDDISSLDLKLEYAELSEKKAIRVEIESKQAELIILFQKQKEIQAEINRLESELEIKTELLERSRSEQEKLIKTNEKLSNTIRLKKDDIKTLIIKQSPSIIFSTNSCSAILSKYNCKPFDLLVIDEITQSTQPSCIIPINLSKKVIIAGDHHQLPPTVFLKNKDYDEDIDPNLEKRRIKSYQLLSGSLFELIYNDIKNCSEHCIFLKDQFRMNPIIVDFLNQSIYKDTPLESDSSTLRHVVSQGMFNTPLVFINSNSPEIKEYSSEEFSMSRIEYSNEAECKLVVKIIDKYLNSGVSSDKIGVISPYTAQVRKLNNILEKKGLIAKTVDSFQGQEKDIIILSLVRSNLYDAARPALKIGFLVDERRFNVAITRFKRKLIVIGSEDTLSLSSLDTQEYYDIYEEKKKPIYYNSFIKYVKSKGKFISGKDIDKLLTKKLNIQFEENSCDKVMISKTFTTKILAKLKL